MPELETTMALWVVLFVQGSVLLYVLARIHQLPGMLSGLLPGSRIPNIQVESPSGERIQVRELMHGPTLLCLVTRGCPYCELVAPHLDTFRRSNPEFSLIIIAGGDSASARAFADKTSISTPVYSADISLFKKNFQVENLPFSFLTNSNGIVLRRGALSKETLLSWLVDTPLYTRTHPESL